MDFRLTDDQRQILDALDKLADTFDDIANDFHGFALVRPDLREALAEGGFFDIAGFEELGPLPASMAVERIAQLPCTAEVALSMLVSPLIADVGYDPIALVRPGQAGRFVDSAKWLLVVDATRYGLIEAAVADVTSVESIYAYPMGRAKDLAQVTWLEDSLTARIDARLKLAIAAELVGLMAAAQAATIEHISVRKQFGRELGTFQALRHRMAECRVQIGGARWLMLKAAATGDPGDAALALFHAQDAGTRLCYEVHQMMGAMGMTLEMSLHLWTYRIKALLSDMGGRGVQAEAVLEQCFGGVNVV
jgi:alkylation response protein AidB-like acyl-CoA dehydrogenase